MMTDSSVAIIDRASRMLAEAVNLEDIKAVRDLAAAAVEYAKAAKLGKDAERHAANIKLRAERKAGETLAELKRTPPEKARITGDVASDYKHALEESGTTYRDANRWEQVAEVPDDLFEEYVATADEPTTSGLLNEKRQAEKKTAQQEREAAKARQVAESPDRPLVQFARAQDWLEFRDPCDLLLTDPPYMTDVEDILDFAESWLPKALALVKPTGRSYVFIGPYPEELNAYLGAYAEAASLSDDVPTLANILVWTYRNTLGPKPTHIYKNNWQAVLYFVGSDAAPLDCPSMVEQFAVQDINAPDGRQGDRYHAWQKPMEIAERFIRHSTKPGDLVYDPFAGTGTHLLAAAKLGRRAIGCEWDKDTAAIAVRRGCRFED